MTDHRVEPFNLGPMPSAARMVTVDQQTVACDIPTIFALALDVERWPALLPHYRDVHFVARTTDGGGVVEMSAWRPFALFDWPTWWRSEMQVFRGSPGEPPWIRYVHMAGITRRMQVLWGFKPAGSGTMVTLLHMWNGPRWPVVGHFAAQRVIGPVFVHGIATRTLAGLAAAAERQI